MFRPARKLRHNAGSLQFRLEDGDRTLDIVGAHVPSQLDQVRKLVVPLRLERLEGEVFELPLHLPNAEALRKWRIDLKRLSGDAALLLRWERGEGAHVMQPITELDEHNTDVL